MAVYVDNFYMTGAGNFGRMKMSHMWADTHDELVEMAYQIGMHGKWIQHEGTANEHFDVSLSRRKLAIQYGAIEKNFRDYAKFIENRAAKHGIPWTHTSITKINQIPEG